MEYDKFNNIPHQIRFKILDEAARLGYYSVCRCRYFCYLADDNGEICKVTVAFRPPTSMKTVAVHWLHPERHNGNCIARDMKLSYMGGYHSAIDGRRLADEKKIYGRGYDEWGEEEDKMFDPFAWCVNVEYLADTTFRYCGMPETYEDVLGWLRMYEKYPQIEYFGKAHLTKLAMSEQICRKCNKDKGFVRFIYANLDFLQGNYQYGIPDIIRAYQFGRTVKEQSRLTDIRKSLNQYGIKGAYLSKFADTELERLKAYINANTDKRSYNDYMEACDALHIDMSDTKNKYPRNFKRWHDLRIEQYSLIKELRSEQERMKVEKQFREVSEKYGYTAFAQCGLTIFCAREMGDLQAEGEALHHCVGRMNYGTKMSREESLILFVRRESDIDTPLVTVEYDPKSNVVLQCYGDHDSKPSEEIIRFVYTDWINAMSTIIKSRKAG